MTRRCVVHSRYFANDGFCVLCRDQYEGTNVISLRVPGPSAEDMMAYRKSAAAIARGVRALWPGLVAKWTRRDWNTQAKIAAYNHIARMIRNQRIENKQRQGAMK